MRITGRSKVRPRALTLVFLLAVTARLAIGGDSVQGPGIESPVYIPRSMKTYGLVYLKDVWGNAEDQLSELFAQCRLRGIIDLGRGWKDPNPRRAAEGYGSPDPALNWPAFEFPIPEAGKPPTVKDVLAAFFKVRLAFRWEMDEGGIVNVRPASRRRSMDWLLSARFPKPVSSENKDGRWVILDNNIEEAVDSCFPKWKQAGVEFHMQFGRGNFFMPLPPMAVYSPQQISVSSLDEFLKLWLMAEPNRFVFIHEEPSTNAVRPKGAKDINIEADTWNPTRLTAKTSEIVAGLKENSKVPPGYDHQIDRRQDCSRELIRRHHFNREEVRKELSDTSLLKEADYLDGLLNLMLELDIDCFGPYLTAKFWEFPAETQKKMIGPLRQWLPEDAGYKPFWERLAQSENSDLREIGQRELDNMKREKK